MNAKTAHTSGPWEYVPSTEHHGPYVVCEYGPTVCDCYTMSNPAALSVRNGGDSRPVHHMHEMADANARLIAAAPELLAAGQNLVRFFDATGLDTNFLGELRAAIAKATGAAS